MNNDPNALKIWIDGSAFNNPGTDNGLAGIVQYPDSFDKKPEVIFRVGYEESNISRMELRACINKGLYNKRGNRLDAYIIVIRGVEMLHKFMQIINPINPKHIAKYNGFIESTKDLKTNIY